MKRLLLQLIAGIGGLYGAMALLPSVAFSGPPLHLIAAGAVLRAINAFVKPLLHLITFPLKIITFGLFGFILNVALVWGIDIVFPALVIPGIVPLVTVTVIISLASALAGNLP